ncbi:hypothetical protein FOZ63_005463, partial [Perkinsus olseni]
KGVNATSGPNCLSKAASGHADVRSCLATSEVRATVSTLPEALGDPGLSIRLAEGRVARIEVLVGLLTGGHGSESSVVSVLRFEWKRASNTDPTILGEISSEHGAFLSSSTHTTWVIVSSLTLALSIIGILRDIYKIVRSVRLIRGHETELLPREAEAAQGAHSARENRLLLHREVKEVIRRKISWFSGSLMINCLILAFVVWRGTTFTSSAERHAQLVTNVIDAQPSTSETHARLLDLRDSLRRETYSASFGMLLMYLLIWRIIKCLAGHPMVAVLSSTWYTARDEIFHFGQLTAEFRLD